jgi:hypothetical protein
MVPSSVFFDQSTLARLVEYDAVVQEYRALFALFDWHPSSTSGTRRLCASVQPIL